MAQGLVWNSIDEMSSRLGGRSETGSMDDVYDRLETDVDEWIAHFPCDKGQVGLLAFLGARPLAVDSIGCSELWARVHRRFLGGYVMDALAWQGTATAQARSGAALDSEAARQFLDAVGSARRISSDTVGSGEYRVLAGEAIGGELVAELDGYRSIVHLSAFPAETGHRRPRSATRSGSDTPLSPPSRRRHG